MITRQQYMQARKVLDLAQKESSAANRNNDEVALDKAGEKAVKAFAIIAAYKDEQARKA
jgi:hypothetical protein